MKRSLRLILSIMLVIAFVVTSLGFAAITVKGVKLNASNITLEVGKTYVLKTSFTPANTTQKLLSYSTSSKSVATVDKNGVVKAVKVGKAVITVTSGSNKNVKASCAVTVIANKATKQVKLKWVFMGPGKQQDSEKVWAEFNKKLASYLPNTTVNFTVLGRLEQVEKWKLLAASGEQIDLAWTGWLIPFVPEVNKGAYIPLNDLIKQYAPNISSGVPAWVMGRTTIDGKIYAIPNQQMEATDGNSIKVPNELAKKYMDMQKIMDVNQAAETRTKECWDVIETGYLKPLKEAGQLQKGAGIFSMIQFLTSKGYESFASVNYVAAIKRSDSTFKVVNWFETPEVKTAYDVAADWFKKGYIRKDILSLQDPRAEDGKIAGTVAWSHSHMGKGPVVTPGNPAANLVEFVSVPLDKKGFIGMGDSATSTAITRTSKNPERAMQLLDLMNTDRGKDLYRLLVWGIEGEHYKRISEDEIETIGYVGQGTPDAKYGLWKWVMGNTFIGFNSQADKATPLSYIKNMNDTAEKSKLMAFKADTRAITNEIVQCTAIVNEFEPSLKSGALADYQDRYKQFIAKLKAAGVDKIVAEMQKQVDELVKKNNIK